jgi:P4 family phage/plasmid primase-like protien
VDIAATYGPRYVFGKGEEGKPPPVIGFNGIHWAALYATGVEIIFDPSSNRLYQYASGRGLWCQVTPDAIKIDLGSLLLEVARADGHENLAVRNRSDGLLNGWVNHLRGITERREAFTNRPTGLLHVANGFVDVATGDLLPFRPDYLSRNQSPISYQPGATCPRFVRDLLESALDTDDIRVVQRYAGLALLGRNSAQKALVFTGTPAGGKSTIVTVIEHVTGVANVTQLRTEQLAERFELFRLVGKTLLCGKDVPGDFLQSKGAHVLKALVGGDLLEAERKGQAEGLQLRGEFCVIVTSNSRLRVKLDGDAGAWERRLIVIEYNRPKPAVAIPHFAELLLQEEAPGILNWMIDGARQLIADGFDFALTDRQKKRVFDLLAESDSVRAFVRDCVTPDAAADVTGDELCEAYAEYCDARGWTALPIRTVQNQLPDLLMECHRAGRRNDIRRNGKNARGFGRVRVSLPEIADEP